MEEGKLKTSEVTKYALFCFFEFLAIMLPMMYAQVFLTNALFIDTAIVASAFLVGRVIDFGITLTSGAIIQTVPLKGGMYRPWIKILQWVAATGIIFEFINTSNLPVAVELIIAIAGYIMLNGMMNFIATCQYGIIAEMGGTNMTDRTRLSVAGTRIGVVATIITSFFFARALTWISNATGGTDPVNPNATSYMVLGFVCAACMIVACQLIMSAAKPYDARIEMPAGAPAPPKTTIGDMVKAVFTNDQLLVYMLYSLLTMTSMYVVSAVGIYYYLYIIAGEQSIFAAANPYITMGNVTTLTSLFGLVAAMVGPRIGQKLGKKNALTATLCTGVVANICITLFAAKSIYIFVTIQLVNMIAAYFSAAFAIVYLLDIGEYGYYKSGKDNRSIMYSMANVPMKIGMAVGGSLGLFLLSAIGFKNAAGFVPDAAFTQKFMYIFGGVPAIFYIVAACVWIFGYKITDEKAAMYAKENAAKAGFGPGGPGAPVPEAE